MADEDKKHRRRFDPAMLGTEPPKLDTNMMGIVGQMLGGIGSGIGTGVANKLNERVTLAAAALQGILASPNNEDRTPDDVAHSALDCADALLTRLEKVPDPRFAEGSRIEALGGSVEYHDAVQRLCELAETAADLLDKHDANVGVADSLRTRVKAVYDAGRKP